MWTRGAEGPRIRPDTQFSSLIKYYSPWEICVGRGREGAGVKYDWFGGAIISRG